MFQFYNAMLKNCLCQVLVNIVFQFSIPSTGVFILSYILRNDNKYTTSHTTSVLEL